MAFDDVRLPDDVEQGAQGGPTFYTSILRMGSGSEVRNQNWVQQKCLFNVAYGVQSKSDFFVVLAFFYARRGRARAFRFKDWSDYQATLQVPTMLTATTYQLMNIYNDGVVSYSRKITRPVVGTLSVFYAGTLMTTGYTIDTTTGIITFATAPANPALVQCSFEFDIPVRFDSDDFALTLDTFDSAAVNALNIVEILE